MTLRFQGLQKMKTVVVSLLVSRYDNIDDNEFWFGYAGDGNIFDLVRFCDIELEQVINDFKKYLDDNGIKLFEKTFYHFNPETEQEVMDEFLQLEYKLFEK